MSTTALSRRNFLGGFGLTMTAAAIAPQLSFARNSQNGGPIILGAGNHKYEWVKDWAKLPTGVYKVDATVMGKTIEQTVHVPATGQVHAFFAWPAPPSTSLASAHTMAK